MLIFAQVLLPALPPDSVIVLDNARFHHSPSTLKLATDAAATCYSCRPIRLISTRSNILGPPSRPACAKTSPPPPTPSFLSPVCAYVIV